MEKESRKEVKIEIAIKCCDQCPFFNIKRVYTPDSFENCFNWVCLKMRGAIIKQMETFSKKPEVPK